MIRSFRSRRLQLLFERGTRSGIGAREAERIRQILHRLDQAERVSQLRLPGYRLHQLHGDREGVWSIRVTRNWRISFRFEAGDASDVDYEDYH